MPCRPTIYLLALGIGLSAVARAQPVIDPDTAAAHREIRVMGDVFSREVIDRTQAIYIALHRKAPPDKVSVERDLAYGPDAKHRLDLYQSPAVDGAPRPAVVFLHGGGLVRGDKTVAGSDGLLYGNVARYFARSGMVGVNATYRLVPNITYPQGGEDVRAIVAWLKEHAAAYRIDPGAVFLLCVSAGCTHVATYLFDARLHPAGGPGVAGAILMSGAYLAEPDNEAHRAYFGDGEAMSRRAPLSLAAAYTGPAVPVFLTSAEFDGVGTQRQTAALFHAICDTPAGCPRFKQLANHNHFSNEAHINTADDSLGPDMLQFIEAATAAD